MITGKRQDPQTNAFFSNRGDYLSHKTKTIVIWRPRASMKWVRPLQKKVFFMLERNISTINKSSGATRVSIEV
jgi:hypothetical protein